MLKKERAGIILKEVDHLYPDASCELNYQTAFQLLIAVVLSAQTTDISVNKVTPRLWEHFPTIESLAYANVKDVEECIKQIGLYRNKAKNIIALAQVIHEEMDDQVPHTKKALITLPGVGVKTANVVLAEYYHIPAFAVDTHVSRISKRLRLAKMDDDVQTIEKKLCQVIPKERWIKTHHQFIFFGRYFCKAQNPNCAQCPLFDLCVDPIKYKRKPIESSR